MAAAFTRGTRVVREGPGGRAALADAWKSQRRLTGPNAVPDFANPAQMNHFT